MNSSKQHPSVLCVLPGTGSPSDCLLLAREAFWIVDECSFPPAFGVIRRTDPDCILVDWTNRDPLDFDQLTILAATGKPIVLVLRGRDADLVSSAVNAGATDCLTDEGLTLQLLKKSVSQSIEIARLKKQLAEQQEELQNFVSAASHDLRAPLQHMIHIAEASKEECVGKVDPDVVVGLERLVSGGKRMTQLLDSLIAFSREGRAVDAFHPVDLADSVKRALANLQELIQSSEAKIEVAEMPWVLGDEISLSQVLQNLISNAIKYSGNKKPAIEIFAERDDADWKIAVRDNGMGIPGEFLQRVF